MFNGGKPSILIVDDDMGILNAFRKIFQKKGYAVTVAEKGLEAIEKLSMRQYDVTLIDLSLPGMKGSALFPLIKNSSPKTLRILLTGKAWLQPSVEDADAFFEKPIKPDKLLNIIDTELKKRDTEPSFISEPPVYITKMHQIKLNVHVFSSVQSNA